MRRRQRGVALLSVLLVMSLALLLTAGMLRSHQLMVQSSARQIHQVQLRQWALSAEAWALEILQATADDQNSRVHQGQAWARATWPFETQGARITLEIEDLSARFNVNALLGEGQVDRLIEQRWLRLLAALGLPPLDLRAAGPVAEQRELSQLRLLPGIDGATLRQLEPWVALLPKDASLNINTALPQVLATLEGMSPPTAEALVNQRPTTGYGSVQAFIHDPLIAGLGVTGHGLGISSRWFRINVDVRLGTSRLRLASEVERERKTGRWRVVQRRFPTPTLSENAL
ncbi:type II secretion system protein GspK [Pseudomonas grimontii]|uniref:type II secretion system protein GspK n=1 Tax=Pseudomonas grimontii TaxID=129847 RepID=UPI00216A7533|nr:type II secretion system protein GspK [Pseudomonas grimontii]MCS3512967.1 general secretion pathway protein K [Pseudomonas grimontii]